MELEMFEGIVSEPESVTACSFNLLFCSLTCMHITDNCNPT